MDCDETGAPDKVPTLSTRNNRIHTDSATGQFPLILTSEEGVFVKQNDVSSALQNSVGSRETGKTTTNNDNVWRSHYVEMRRKGGMK